MSNYTDGLIGDYSTDTDPSLILTPLHGIKKLAPNVQFASGCSNSTCTDYRATDVAAAVDGAQVVFVALGTGFIVEAENNDRSDIVLPGAQLQLLKDAVYHGEDRSSCYHFLYGSLQPTVALWCCCSSTEAPWTSHSPN